MPKDGNGPGRVAAGDIVKRAEAPVKCEAKPWYGRALTFARCWPYHAKAEAMPTSPEARMRSYNVVPWHFWLGLGLALVGGGLIFVCEGFSWPGGTAGLVMFIAGMALTTTGSLFPRSRRPSADRDDADGPPGSRTRRRAPVLGTALICFGIFGAVICVRAGGTALVGLVVAFFAVVLGVISFFDRSVPDREFRATGPESPALIRLGVHVKYLVVLLMFAGMIVGAGFYRPAPSATTSQRMEWWVVVVVVALPAVVFAGKYVWHCWIKKDYEEPEFLHS
jgi:hypothetical protein